jgi:hypothetical protein
MTPETEFMRQWLDAHVKLLKITFITLAHWETRVGPVETKTTVRFTVSNDGLRTDEIELIVPKVISIFSAYDAIYHVKDAYGVEIFVNEDFLARELNLETTNHLVIRETLSLKT